MHIRLLNMGFEYNNGKYTKVNTDLTVEITGTTLIVWVGENEYPNSTISDLENLLLEHYGDEL